ncbi:MAG TPA: SDR family oxidoreductase [Streptosporangiaceae bacterium]|nr:SDR family oxidoreductase [Streptosporangiaceae bacterium]
MSEVTVVIGARQIGQAIARRVSAGKHVLLADLRQANAEAAAGVLANAGFDASTVTVDVSSRESVHALAEAAAARGDVTGVIHAAGVSQSGHRLGALTPEQDTVRWGKRGARVNTTSPGIIITPLARDELTGPRGEGYRRMIEFSPAGRAGTPDEVGTVGALLMGPEGAFITVRSGSTPSPGPASLVAERRRGSLHTRSAQRLAFPRRRANPVHHRRPRP